MGSDKEFVDFILDQTADSLPITARKMFGEYGLYAGGKMIALVCDNRLLVKPTPGGREFIGEVNEVPPYPGAKPCFLIEDAIEDREWLCRLLHITEQELPLPRPKTPRSTKKSK
jgi:TfoX/Sxy family transcriptional regulator of competence genes